MAGMACAAAPERARLDRFLDRFVGAGSLAEAVAVFSDALDRHALRIAETQARTEAIFRSRTPDRPFVQYTPTDLDTALDVGPPAWAATERHRLLATQLSGIIANLELLPESDYLPTLSPGYGTSDLIPRMLGAEVEVVDGCVLPRSYLLSDLARDLPVLGMPDPATAEPCRNLLETCRFLVEATRGCVPLAYPQMQGPTTNAVRLMDQEEYLVACLTEPDRIRSLSEHLTRIIIAITKSLWYAVGDQALTRPRQRGAQPEWVCGLMVDDYLSVLSPRTYLEVVGSSWDLMARELGPIFLHTCGPTLQWGESLAQLPGLAGLETSFVRGFSKTTDDLCAQKAALGGRAVLQSFVLPDGSTVHDEANLTARWLESISNGGGFMLHAAGSVETGRRLLRDLLS